MELLDLPPELISQYALSLNLGQINNLCLTSKQFNQAICANEHFWKMKFTHDYKCTPEYTGSWKKLYQNYNSVWTFGSNYTGQLGLGDQDDRSTPTQITQLKPKAISVGGGYTLLIDLDDNVWSFGWNMYGQLGLGDQQQRLIPTLIPQSESSTDSREPRGARLSFKAKAVSTGEYHTVLIDLEDNVWAFGHNYYGQLGLGDQQRRSTPTQIPGIKAKAISVGGGYTILIDLENNVWSFGWNGYGQLGLGDQQDRSIPTLIPQLKAKAVSSGSAHTVLIDLDDNVWSFGHNGSGQLGLGDQQDRSTPTLIPQLKAKAISAGRSHTVLIDLDDNVWSFGRNEHGQLGLGDWGNRSTPTLIPQLESPTSSRESSGARLSFKAKAVSSGGGNTLLIDLDDNVWSFGWNIHGILGLGDEQDRSTPTLIPHFKAKAISAGEDHNSMIATLITS